MVKLDDILDDIYESVCEAERINKNYGPLVRELVLKVEDRLTGEFYDIDECVMVYARGELHLVINTAAAARDEELEGQALIDQAETAARYLTAENADAGTAGDSPAIAGPSPAKMPMPDLGPIGFRRTSAKHSSGRSPNDRPHKAHHPRHA